MKREQIRRELEKKLRARNKKLRQKGNALSAYPNIVCLSDKQFTAMVLYVIDKMIKDGILPKNILRRSKKPNRR